jgi:hypothetical protein
MIDEYKFGKMVVDGETHDKDLIITKNKIIPNWWRDKGHKLKLQDIKEVLEECKPDVLVVGKGKFGMMSVSDDLRNYLEEHEIEIYEKESGKATQEFNRRLNKGDNVVGAFHLTC